MLLKLYNTMTHQVEVFDPPKDQLVGVYACGITAYDYAHIGNLRRYVGDDILIRTLRYDRYQVKFVQNVTDVGHLVSDGDEGEDKLEKGARKTGQSVYDTARKFEDYFYQSSARLGNLRPDEVLRASDYIAQQLLIAQELERKGFAYLIPNEGLYFDTSKSTHYGQLAGLNLAQLKEGARVEKVAGKRNPTDFAVWKLEKPGEKRQMVWPSPWGERSYPGWHLECVAMSIDQLGPQFAIHTGGIDHIPVHHVNEIAQAEAYTGKSPFVQIWLHHNFMRVNGEKMSKSLGNTYRLEDIEAKGFSPMSLRYLFLTSHYRKELNFTWDSLAAADKAYRRLVAALFDLSQEDKQTMALEDNIERTNKYRDRFLTAINNDLDTPQALVVLGEILKANLGNGERYDLIIELDNLLGLQLRQAVTNYQPKLVPVAPTMISDEAQSLLAQREEARQKKDFSRADELRAHLQQLGYQIIDTPVGARLQRINDHS